LQQQSAARATLMAAAACMTWPRQLANWLCGSAAVSRLAPLLAGATKCETTATTARNSLCDLFMHGDKI